MAEEFVRKEQFGEFVKRMDERFDHIQKDMTNGFAYVNQLAEQRYESINQRLADAEKARDQNLVHVNERFDDMNHRFDDMNRRFDDMHRRLDDVVGSVKQGFDTLEKRFDYQNRFVVGVVTTILAAALAVVGKYLFFSS